MVHLRLHSQALQHQGGRIFGEGLLKGKKTKKKKVGKKGWINKTIKNGQIYGYLQSGNKSQKRNKNFKHFDCFDALSSNHNKLNGV